ncbi:hypothetical protein GOP47_0003616 [Adiantum capillus-veneris]|uniref:Uncharacterized protein n=1 Tax=Adiantum capillus-veneris TaxID=13818 RepID=A0A9D4V763_ADICA|nr:hypothetical protein GOP47_0003616 [Adiantum capillus-veneris]
MQPSIGEYHVVNRRQPSRCASSKSLNRVAELTAATDSSRVCEQEIGHNRELQAVKGLKAKHSVALFNKRVCKQHEQHLFFLLENEQGNWAALQR